MFSLNLKGLSVIAALIGVTPGHADASVSHHAHAVQRPAKTESKSRKPKLKLLHQCSVFDNTIDSLACAMYFEARSDGLLGMLLVGETIINRTHADEYSDRIKSVIFQPYQFSYTNRKKGEGKIVVRKVYEQESWDTARAIAKYLLTREKTTIQDIELRDTSHGATMYHKVGEHVIWAKDYQKLFTYKSHVFYRKKVIS